jgi:hypothetical protein
MAVADVGAGREALEQIRKVLAERPKRDGHALTAAVQALTEYRDHYVERHRREGGSRYRATLERINAVVSVVLGAEFPLGEVPWGELEKARDWLNDILRDEAAQSPFE